MTIGKKGWFFIGTGTGWLVGGLLVGLVVNLIRNRIAAAAVDDAITESVTGISTQIGNWFSGPTALDDWDELKGEYMQNMFQHPIESGDAQIPPGFTGPSLTE